MDVTTCASGNRSVKYYTCTILVSLLVAACLILGILVRVTTREHEPITFHRGFGPIRGAVFSTDAMHVITATRDGTLRKWDCDNMSRKTIATVKEGIVCIESAADGRCFFVISPNGHIEEWDRRSLGKIRSIRVPCDDIVAVAVDGTGKRLLTSDRSPAIKGWTLEPMPREINTWRVKEWTHTIALSADGMIAAFRSISESGVIAVQFEDKLPAVTFNRAVSSLAFVGSSQVMAMGYEDGKIELVQANATGRDMVCQIAEGATAITTSENGRFLAAGNPPGEVIVWDLKNKKMLCKLQAHPAVVVGVRFSPDGKRLVSWCSDIGFNDQPGHAEAKLFLVSGVD